MLPIKRVTLFKHGTGYFERSGEVSGDQIIELGFKANQMNDVLKSLTTLDYDGGGFAALSYDSEEPFERRLSELNITIPDKGAISAFLDRLKGARVSMVRGDEELAGTIVGIEERQLVDRQEVVEESHLAVLVDGARLVKIPLAEMDELRLDDESVQRDLQDLLEILFSSLRKDRKTLSIQARGEGRRRISISYVIEAPVWKTTYRIVLPGDEASKPLLQGWAIVDNTTEDDWNGVKLGLVSGLPISFVHDLYTPRYKTRPVVRVEQEAAVAPPIIEADEGLEVREDEGLELRTHLNLFPMAYESDPLDNIITNGAEAPPSPMADAAMLDKVRESIQVHTRTQEVGNLFSYDIAQPVDIARSCSALVPILQADADMERAAIYNPEICDKNPMAAFRFKNSTGLTLEGGPVTVFEGDMYAGEAMLDTIRQEDERIIPYSVELGITVKNEESHIKERFNRIIKSGNYLYKYYRLLRRVTYEFNSNLDRLITVYLDHRFHDNVREDTPDPVEITEHFWRFKLDLPARKKTVFPVTEVSEQFESIEIPGIATSSIHQMASDKLISKKTQKALENIAAKVEQINRIEEDIGKKEESIVQIEEGQNRVRENLKALAVTSEEGKLRQKYVSNLTTQEEVIEKLRMEVAELKDRLERERQMLEEMIEQLDIREKI